MNLLFAINKKFVRLFLNCLKSIAKNGGADKYNVYILHSDLDKDDKAEIEGFCAERFNYHFVDINAEWFEGFPESERYPKQIYYRLAAPLLLPNELERILYLDVDTVIINSLEELYKTDFGGAYYVACTHTGGFLTEINRLRLGMEDDAVYVNTGIMLLNLPALRENIRLEDIRDYANRHQHTLILPDQDIVSALYGDKVKLTDTLKYNLSDRILALHNADPRNDKIDLDWVRKNAVVIHYFGKNKPWNENYIGILNVFYNEMHQD